MDKVYPSLKEKITKAIPDSLLVEGHYCALQSGEQSHSFS